MFEGADLYSINRGSLIMAAKSSGSGRKSSSSKSRSTNAKKNNSRDVRNMVSVDDSIKDEAILLLILAVSILVYLALFGALGSFGGVISNVFFGLFGWVSYIIPFVAFMASAFFLSNKGRGVAYIKVVSAILLALNLSALCEMIFDSEFLSNADNIFSFYSNCSENKTGGGLFGGSLSYFLCRSIGTAGTYILILILCIVFIVLITEKSFFTGVKKGSENIYNSARDNTERYKERRDEKRKQREAYLREHPKEENNKKRRDNVVSGVSLDTTIQPSVENADDIHEISSNGANLEDSFSNINIKTVHNIEYEHDEDELQPERHEQAVERAKAFDGDYSGNYHKSDDSVKKMPTSRFLGDPGISDVTDDEELFVDSASHNNRFESDFNSDYAPNRNLEFEQPGNTNSYSGNFETPKVDLGFDNLNITGENITGHGVVKDHEKQTDYEESYISNDPKPVVKKPVKRKSVYKFPPLSMLKPGRKNENTESVAELKETASRLQSTLKTFGVNVTITDIAQGPSVTRYEMQPEVGTKVSKITNLQDDIKLNMAARDIRIEAPIPGKAAVGIEIPNKEVSTVSFRDLLESKNFKEASSKISFAVGKDLSGNTVVADIGKMPHMLIAGATGSGKSVCINTLIMSIIYKATPDEVKLIMVDPKVVELSVYNGIPHLMIPVVTDPKKAAAALNWGVAEMTDRYNKFAEFGVRDLKGYNKKLESVMSDVPESDRPKKLPQIVIIVDELADLMMVASNEVEASICRLAQLARAAGIHLIIATQRPSVDVITGLIKANMPSRIAFSVSSGVDSRTILDMNGAERLLGKGDMLFYPQGYTKPARVQGAFISDEEISEIVDFLKANAGDADLYDEEVLAKVNSQVSDSSNSAGGMGGTSSGSDSDKDQYFIEAARLAIEQDKASIGYFQRKFKIGFNRAARIMDQLYEAGIVAAEEGTKPRRVLMSMEQFENALEQGEF